MFKRLSALFSTMLAISHLDEQIKEMELWEKNQCYSMVHYSDFRLSDEFEKELLMLNLNEHKKVLYMRELITKHKEINTRLLKKQKEEHKEKTKKEMLDLPRRIERIEKELADIKTLLSR